MCGQHTEGEHRHGRGRRGFGRRGFPDREHLLERLQGYGEHLESELGNVRDLIARLGDEPKAPAEG